MFIIQGQSSVILSHIREAGGKLQTQLSSSVCQQNKRRKVRSRKQRVCTYIYIHMYMYVYNIVLIQLLERRSKVTRDGEEKERFAALTLDYMSEESSSDGGETMLVHQPPWCSSSRLLFPQLSWNTNSSVLQFLSCSYSPLLFFIQLSTLI